MFQQKETAEDLEEVAVAFADVIAPPDGSGVLRLRLPHLLVQMGLASSTAEANRKIAENAVRFEGTPTTKRVVAVEKLPARLVVRLGKRAKVAVVA